MNNLDKGSGKKKTGNYGKSRSGSKISSYSKIRSGSFLWNRENRENLDKKEVFLILGKSFLPMAAAAFLFYDSPIALIAGIPVLLLFAEKGLKKAEDQKRELLEAHFKEALLAILAALRAGYAVENAFVQAQKDLRFRFGEKDKMAEELVRINRQVKNNIPIERLVEEFAKRSRSEDIRDFAAIFKIAKKSGGDMGKIMQRTISILTRRIEIKTEIRLLLAAKKYEQTVMDLVPLFIIAYIRFTSPGYFAALYHNLPGVLIMSAALAVYLTAYLLSEKILSIV